MATSILIRGDDDNFYFLQHTKVLEVTIGENESLSDVIDVRGFRQMALGMPSEWTTANITFQNADKEDGDFLDVYDDDGDELLVKAAADRLIVLSGQAEKMPDSMNVVAPLRFIKLRSGTSGTPVDQGDDRKIKVYLSR